MRNLILSELIRFQKWALSAGLLHLVILYAANSVSPIVDGDSAFSQLAPIIFALATTALGFYQLGSYSKISQWTYLIHRAVSPAKIYSAFVISALILIVGVLLLPLLIVFALSDVVGSHLVEGRHYLIFPYLLGLCLSCYFAASIAVLHPKRIKWLVFLLPFSLFGVKSGSLSMFVVEYAIVAGLAMLGYITFKPNLSELPKKTAALLASSVLLQVCCFTIVSWLAFNSTQLGMYVLGIHPFSNPVENGFYQVTREMEVKERILHALEKADDKTKSEYERKIKVGEPELIKHAHERYLRFSKPNQPHFLDRSLSFVDQQNKIYWQFSHEQMLYSGTDIKSKQWYGWLGREGMIEPGQEIDEQQRFNAIPSKTRGDFIFTPDAIYRYDSELKQAVLKVQLQEDQNIVLVKPNEQYIAVLSNTHLYLYFNNFLLNDESLLEPFAVYPLSRPANQLFELSATPLVDGFLLGVVYADRSERYGTADSEMVLSKVTYDNTFERLAQRDYIEQSSTVLVNVEWIISPLFKLLDEQIKIATGAQSVSSNALDKVSQVWSEVLLMLLLSAAVIALLLRNKPLNRRSKLIWVGSAIIGGLPALLVFLFLINWRSPSAKLENQTA